MNNNLDLKVYVSSELRHTSYLYNGLRLLEQKNYFNSLKFIPEYYFHKNRVIVKNKKISRVNRPYPYSVRVKLFNKNSKKQIMVAFDLQDWDYMFSYICLKRCQIIFKRAFNIDKVNIINKNFNSVEIKPFGFTHFVDFNDKEILLLSKISNLINKIFYIFFDINRAKIFFLTNFSKTFQKKPNKIINNKLLKIPPEYPFIFYQVEYHDWPGSQEAKKINIQRAKLIRLMKKEFGIQFIGGMFFKKHIDIEFSDCKTNVSYDKNVYLSFVKKAAIVISTNGFGNSLPWKLAEYLKYGCCTVSEELVHFLENPIINGKHVEIFNSNQDCVYICKKIINNKKHINLIRKNAMIYYNLNIKPDQSLINNLKIVMKNID